MSGDNSIPLDCPRCGEEVRQDNDFCPNCGDIFLQNESCSNHPGSIAAGVCVICSRAFCSKCGGLVGQQFLCDNHSMCEIYEGMVRVYGVLDDLAAQYAKSCLQQAGLHPLLYSRTQPKGGPRFVYTLFEAAGEYDGHIVNEIKVMVPCQEFGEAEEVLSGAVAHDITRQKAGSRPVGRS